MNRLRLHGGPAAILSGPCTVAAISSWQIAQVHGKWTLVAQLARADAFQLRYLRPLYFAAPRAGGFWTWGVEALQVGPSCQSLRATVVPEQ